MKKHINLLSLMFLVSCGKIKEIPNELIGVESEKETVTVTITPTAIPAPINPICKKVELFRGGTLWKPEGENNSNCVMLLRPQLVKPFSSCTAELKNGKIDEFVYTGFSNGDRQTWRCNFPASRYKRKLSILCREFAQECEFKLRQKPTIRQE